MFKKNINNKSRKGLNAGRSLLVFVHKKYTFFREVLRKIQDQTNTFNRQ